MISELEAVVSLEVSEVKLVEGKVGKNPSQLTNTVVKRIKKTGKRRPPCFILLNQRNLAFVAVRGHPPMPMWY
jgi:hypothetical protein